MTEPLNTRIAQVLAVPTRARLLHLLRATGRPSSAPDLAAAVELHVNTVRSHLELLVEVGLASRTVRKPHGPGRPQVVYQAERQSVGDAGHDTGYRDLAAALIGELVAEGDADRHAIAAGRRWATTFEQIDWSERPHDQSEATGLIVELLTHAGFAPSVEPLGDRIYLHACPFAELARRSPSVVCGVHLGLLRGAIDRLRTPLLVEDVKPFVRPDLCLIELRTTPSD